MFLAKLFLGLEVTPEVDELLAQANPELFKIFIKKDDVYLHDFTYDGTRYLGKFAGEHTNLASLELLEENIRTLLCKVIPHTDLSLLPLKLFSLVEPRSHARK